MRAVVALGGRAGSSLGSSRIFADVVAACARLCVAASVALARRGERARGERRRRRVAAADDDEEEDTRRISIAAGREARRRRVVLRSPPTRTTATRDAATRGIGRRAGSREPPRRFASRPATVAESFASLTGRPVRLAAGHRCTRRNRVPLRATPLGALSRVRPGLGRGRRRGRGRTRRSEVGPSGPPSGGLDAARLTSDDF